MRITKEMIEKASNAYADKRHPARWDGEPWGQAGVKNHELAIKAALSAVLKDYKPQQKVKIVELHPMQNDATWQGAMLGLGDDGVVYENKGKGWIGVLDNKFI